MGFNSKGEFCVGTTTLDTMFKVVVDDYGVDLPEIHSRGPMIYPQNICVRYIINWLERGLCVSFEKKEDEEKVLYFVIDYNKYAKEINEAEGKVVYKLALVAQKWLITDLHWTTIKEKNESIEKHPEKRNPFVKINRRDSSIDASKKIYNNESIRAKFGKKNINKVEEAIAKQLSSHEYDIFENTPQDADEIGNTYMSDPTLVLTND